VETPSAIKLSQIISLPVFCTKLILRLEALDFKLRRN